MRLCGEGVCWKRTLKIQCYSYVYGLLASGSELTEWRDFSIYYNHIYMSVRRLCGVVANIQESAVFVKPRFPSQKMLCIHLLVNIS